MYKDAWESITGNCDTFLFLGGQEQTTLEYVSKKLGKVTILANGYSRSRGGQGSRTESENIKGRDLMSPDEISRMDNKNCILFIRGLLPFFCRKYDYPKHKNYKYTGDADDKNLYDYRNPERFAIEDKSAKRKPARRKTAPARPRRTKKDVFEGAKDVSNAQSEKTIEEKRKGIQHARDSVKPATPENLAKSVGVENAINNAEQVNDNIAKALTPVGGFIRDYEFRGAENYYSDFLGKEEDLRKAEEEKNAENTMPVKETEQPATEVSSTANSDEKEVPSSSHADSGENPEEPKPVTTEMADASDIPDNAEIIENPAIDEFGGVDEDGNVSEPENESENKDVSDNEASGQEADDSDDEIGNPIIDEDDEDDYEKAGIDSNIQPGVDFTEDDAVDDSYVASFENEDV